MAMLARSRSGILELGGSGDICFICAKKEKVRYEEAKRSFQGRLDGKIVLRTGNEKCICLECIEEAATKMREIADNGHIMDGDVYI